MSQRPTAFNYGRAADSPNQRDLEAARDRFRDLLGGSTHESDWQRFFTEHPYVLSLSLPVRLEPSDILPLGRAGRTEPDFAFYPRRTSPIPFYGVIELKRPESRIVSIVRDNVAILTRDAETAIAQAKMYVRDAPFLPIHLRQHPLFLGNKNYIFVIMGMSSEISSKLGNQLYRDIIERRLPENLQLLPYDVILHRFEEQVRPKVYFLFPARSSDRPICLVLKFDSHSTEQVAANLPKLSFKFGVPQPSLSGSVFQLPSSGQVYVCSDERFVLTHEVASEVWESGYWSGPEPYYSEWIPASSVHDDELWGLGQKHTRHAGFNVQPHYYDAGVEAGKPFMKEVSHEEAEELAGIWVPTRDGPSESLVAAADLLSEHTTKQLLELPYCGLTGNSRRCKLELTVLREATARTDCTARDLVALLKRNADSLGYHEPKPKTLVLAAIRTRLATCSKQDLSELLEETRLGGPPYGSSEDDRNRYDLKRFAMTEVQLSIIERFLDRDDRDACSLLAHTKSLFPDAQAAIGRALLEKFACSSSDLLDWIRAVAPDLGDTTLFKVRSLVVRELGRRTDCTIQQLISLLPLRNHYRDDLRNEIRSEVDRRLDGKVENLVNRSFKRVITRHRFNTEQRWVLDQIRADLNGQLSVFNEDLYRYESPAGHRYGSFNSICRVFGGGSPYVNDEYRLTGPLAGLIEELNEAVASACCAEEMRRPQE